MQFIHESVREFLLQPHSLADIWPGFQGISEAMSHQQLRDCCTRYISLSDLTELNIPQQLEPAKSEEATDLCERVMIVYPFLGYAAQYVLQHAELSEQFEFSQADILSSFPFKKWKQIHSLLQKHSSRRLVQ